LFLYYITDRKQLSSQNLSSQNEDERTRLLLDRIQDATVAGIDAIQLREKDLPTRDLLQLAKQAAKIVRAANAVASRRQRTRLLINSRVDVAVAADADGVHLRSDDISASEARAIFMHSGIGRPVIAVSCHTVQEVELAEGHGADWAVFGAVFGKAEGAGVGVERLEQACRRKRAANPAMPVVALGGVDLGNAAKCLAAGAAGIAGIRLFQDGNIVQTISELRRTE
jgi:thiamine-phosphate pyrophosphorylase